jgi:hypothetical protein
LEIQGGKNQMEKVLLSKQEAEALESALEMNGGDKASVVHWHAQNLWEGKREVLNDQDLDLIIRALYIGYEVEPGPEEKVLEYFEKLNNKSLSSGRVIVIDVLNLLNIYITGINR